MYSFIALASFAIRQFLLPNPFGPLGDIAVGINLIAGMVLVPLSYHMVGLVYRRGEAPALGSFLFLLTYMINTGVIYLVCLAYPAKWLMGLIAGIYFALVFSIARLLNDYMF